MMFRGAVTMVSSASDAVVGPGRRWFEGIAARGGPSGRPPPGGTRAVAIDEINDLGVTT